MIRASEWDRMRVAQKSHGKNFTTKHKDRNHIEDG